MSNHRLLIAASILAGGIGVGLSRRITDDVEIITVRPGDTVPSLDASEALEVQRREARRAKEESALALHRRQARNDLPPHGSEREAIRRRRQIERGQLKAENGLAR